MIPGNFLASCVFLLCVLYIFILKGREWRVGQHLFCTYNFLNYSFHDIYIYILEMSFSWSSSFSSKFATLISKWLSLASKNRWMTNVGIGIRKMDQHFNRYWFQIMSDMLKTWYWIGLSWFRNMLFITGLKGPTCQGIFLYVSFNPSFCTRSSQPLMSSGWVFGDITSQAIDNDLVTWGIHATPADIRPSHIRWGHSPSKPLLHGFGWYQGYFFHKPTYNFAWI